MGFTVTGGAQFMSRTFTVDEVAEMLHVDKSTVYKLMRSGRLGFVPVTSRQRLVTDDQYEALIANTRIDPDAEAS